MGLKKTSALMNLGGVIDLVDGAAYAEQEVNLPLDALNREVYVVTDVSIDHEQFGFDAALGGTTSISAHIAKTSQDAIIFVNDPTCVGTITARTIQGGAGNLGAGTYQVTMQPDEQSTGTRRDYLSIIATSNFFVGGLFSTTTGGQPNRSVFVRLTGYRAQADLAVYSALIAEEINS